ncbi:MAG: hypothetical protein BRC57_07960 [Cyanobacteria bacterium QS_8_48_54]|nr:MAG: hypothetical protein BRC57_07960 [Cyanobacteria bacterium QS_8_48_54]
MVSEKRQKCINCPNWYEGLNKIFLLCNDCACYLEVPAENSQLLHLARLSQDNRFYSTKLNGECEIIRELSDFYLREAIKPRLWNG